MKIIVVHALYGCESGCCGHAVEVDGVQRDFKFDHPGYRSTPEAVREFVKELVTNACGEEHVKDIDWDNCIVTDD